MKIDEFEQSILARSRSERVLPTARRQAQWSAIESRLLAGALPPLDEGAAGGALPGSAASSAPPGPLGLSSWKMLALGLLLGGAGGYVAGGHGGGDSAAEGKGSAREPVALVEAAPAEDLVNAAEARPEIPTAPQVSEEKEKETSSTTNGAGVRPAGPKEQASPSDDSPAELSLYEELSYLKRAQNALGAGSLALAYGLMKTLEESHPSGALLVERRVTETLALCGLKRRDEAARLAQRLLKTPGSAAYKQRLEGSCAVVSNKDGVEESRREQTDPSASEHE